MSSAKGTSPSELPAPPITPQLPGEGVHRVVDVLPGLGELAVAREVAAGFPLETLLEQARLLCFRGDGFPRVDDHTGHILCPSAYVTDHEPLVVYLDIIHELVHVRQVLEGKPVYHFPQPYVQWPTEVEAYRITYEEAKRLGVDDAWFWRYLSVPWVEEDELVTLARGIGMPEPERLGGTGDEDIARH